MMPPSEIAIRLDVTYDGPAGFATVAVVVTQNEQRELVAMCCAPVVQFDQVLATAVAMLADQTVSAAASISPF